MKNNETELNKMYSENKRMLQILSDISPLIEEGKLFKIVRQYTESAVEAHDLIDKINEAQ